MVLRTFVDTLSTHHTVNGLHIFLVPFRVNTLNPHRTGMIACSAFRAGNTVFFELEQVKSFEKPHQIPHGTDNAPKAFDKKAAHHNRNRKKTAKI